LRPRLQHCSELPREIDGVADSGVHALTANGAVNVRCIAQQKCAAVPEFRNDAVVDVIRREPIDPLDVDADPLDDAPADVVPSELVVRNVRLFLDRPDQTRARFALQRENAEKIG